MRITLYRSDYEPKQWHQLCKDFDLVSYEYGEYELDEGLHHLDINEFSFDVKSGSISKILFKH